MKNGDLATARTVDSHQLVKFRVDNCPTYGVQLKMGDRLLLFIDREWIPAKGNAGLIASHARFIETRQLTATEVKSYMACLMGERLDVSSSELLKQIEKCPAPWRFILDLECLDQTVLMNVLDVSNGVLQTAVRKHPQKYKRFFQEFQGRALIPGPLTATLKHTLEGNHHASVLDSEQTEPCAAAHQLIDSCKHLAESLASYAPKVIPMVIPLIQLLVDHQIPACEPSFVLSLLKSAVGQDCDPVSAHWSKLPLEITLPELQRACSLAKQGMSMSELGANTQTAFLPCVRTHGPYTSEDSYMDTYTRLLREDRLCGLRNAIAALQRGATDSEALRNVPIFPYIKLIGIQMLQS